MASNPAKSRPPQIMPFILVACVLGLAAFVAYNALRRDPGFTQVVAEQNALTRVYDTANETFIATAYRDAERVAGAAWLECSRSVTLTTRRYQVAHPPTHAALDACEIQAVALAESRGYPKDEASKFIQSARASANVAYLDALNRSEQAEKSRSGDGHTFDAPLGKLKGFLGIPR